MDYFESDLAKSKRQLEEANKTIRELSTHFIRDSKVEEQALARKTKELETVLREKKCINCVLCVEDVKLKANSSVDMAQLTAQISLINDTLITKARKVSDLEELLRQANLLVSQVCNHNYRMVLNKSGDFMRQQDALKAKYEQKLMGVED